VPISANLKLANGANLSQLGIGYGANLSQLETSKQCQSQPIKCRLADDNRYSILMR